MLKTSIRMERNLKEVQCVHRHHLRLQHAAVMWLG